MEDVKVDRSIDITREVGEEFSVEVNVGFAGAGNIDSGVAGNGVDSEVGAEEVGFGAKFWTAPGESVAVRSANGDVVRGPDVLLRQDRSCGLGCGGEAFGRIEAIARYGGLGVERCGAKNEREHEKMMADRHSCWP
jgi:hypothetical protein